MTERVTFTVRLITVDDGTWVFAPVPDEHAPDGAGAWGRCPVLASVDGRMWATSAWRDSRRGWLLPVPKAIRAGKGPGDAVVVSIVEDPDRPWPR
jgi:hypothetical protein